MSSLRPHEALPRRAARAGGTQNNGPQACGPGGGAWRARRLPASHTRPLPPPEPRRAPRDRREGLGPETANKVFDPLDLASLGGEKTLMWLLHSLPANRSSYQT